MVPRKSTIISIILFAIDYLLLDILHAQHPCSNEVFDVAGDKFRTGWVLAALSIQVADRKRWNVMILYVKCHCRN